MGRLRRFFVALGVGLGKWMPWLGTKVHLRGRWGVAGSCERLPPRRVRRRGADEESQFGRRPRGEGFRYEGQRLEQLRLGG